MADGGVAGDSLHHLQGAWVRPADEGCFDPPVLIAERNLQMKDLFTVTLEAEMSRLDDPGMYRTDRNLMHLIAGHLKIIHDPHADRLVRRPVPGIATGDERAVKTHRLEPGMIIKDQTALLGNLAFKQLYLRTERRRLKGNGRRLHPYGSRQAGLQPCWQARRPVGCRHWSGNPK